MNRRILPTGASAAAAFALYPRGPRIALAPETGIGEVMTAIREGQAETKGLFDTHADALRTLRRDVEKLGIDSNARMTDIEQAVVSGRRAGAGSGAAVSLGRAVTESDAFKALAGSASQRGSFRISSTRDALETKDITSVAASGGSLIAPDFRPDPAVLPYRRLTIRDLVAPGETTSNAVSYPRMTTRTNNAAPVAEDPSAPKPQSDLNFQLVIAPVQTIAHFFVASRQMLDDAPALRSLIDTEGRYGLGIEEEQQMLLGDGTGVDLLGILPQAVAFAAPFPIASATPLDILIQAIAQLEAGDYQCDGIVVNAVDWRRMQATKDNMGRYLSAGPFGAANSRSLWDVPTVATNSMPSGRFCVGAFKTGAQIYDRMAVEILVSSEHADFFTRNLLAIRAEERLAFAVRRPLNFVTGTFPAPASS